MFETIDLKTVIPEQYRPIELSRTYVSDYSNNGMTFAIFETGDILTIGNFSGNNHVGTFAYLTL